MPLNETSVGNQAIDRPIVQFPPKLARQAQLCKALGDEVRLKVLYLVQDQEVCVCKLIPLLNLPQGTLSHHLGVLQQAGLLSARKQGRMNFYRATPLARKLLAVIP